MKTLSSWTPFAMIGAVTVACSANTPAARLSPELRLSPDQLQRAKRSDVVAPGTSGVAGIETSFIKGEPNASALYSLVLRVPANTRIEAHNHPDDRVATVVAGTWYFGYGSEFDETKLVALAPGSFYTEPPNVMHFARTGEMPVVLLITGFGPTGTTYASQSDDPRK